ncbi:MULTISPECIES: hypothetical protein [unclassified Rhizobium]
MLLLMGRKSLGVSRHNMNLDDDDLARVQAMVGNHGVSKFVREAIREKLDYVSPDEEKAGPPYFEHNGQHEARLTVSGRAAVFGILRKKKASLDEIQAAFGFSDPIDFIHALMGHRVLPDKATTIVITELLGRLYEQR